jgi:hypothetical protein
MKAVETSSVQFISTQQADEILVNCMMHTPKIGAVALLMSSPYHKIYIGQDMNQQMYLCCPTLPKWLWSETFGNGV